MKNILLAITGASPQVVTETLYALHIEGKALPDELYVITTVGSKALLMEGLFENGHLAALQDEYQMPALKFDESHIWLIEDEKGMPIDDAKSIADQTYMADFITRKVFELTQNDDLAIHASIAGGRKTMAFYLGYAMSLLGRPQDTLSHVFVNDEFEFVKDFYYPSKTNHLIKGKVGKGLLDTSTAKITLAEIPFVRMRQSVDPQLISSMGRLSFSQTVATLNSIHSESLKLVLTSKAKSLNIAGVDIKLTGKEFAFYLWLLKITQSEQQDLVIDRYFDKNTKSSSEFLYYFSQISTDIRVFEGTFGITPEDYNVGNYEGLKPMDRTFVQQCRTTINSKLTKALPKALATKIEISSKAIDNSKHYFVAALSHGVRVTINT